MVTSSLCWVGQRSDLAGCRDVRRRQGKDPSQDVTSGYPPHHPVQSRDAAGSTRRRGWGLPGSPRGRRSAAALSGGRGPSGPVWVSVCHSAPFVRHLHGGFCRQTQTGAQRRPLLVAVVTVTVAVVVPCGGWLVFLLAPSLVSGGTHSETTCGEQVSLLK